MSKLVVADGQLWVNQQSMDVFCIGFTESFIRNVLMECWHVIPASGKIKQDDVLVSLETNDGLLSIASPYTGHIVQFNDKAINFPEKLREDDHIVVFKQQQEVVKKKSDYVFEDTSPKKKSRQVPDIDWGAEAVAGTRVVPPSLIRGTQFDARAAREQMQRDMNNVANQPNDFLHDLHGEMLLRHARVVRGDTTREGAAFRQAARHGLDPATRTPRRP